MKATLLTLILGTLATASVHADNIAIFKRSLTETANIHSEQSLVVPAVGNKKLTAVTTLTSYEIVNLTTGESLRVNYDVKLKKYIIGSTNSTIGYRKMPLRVAGTELWYNASVATAEYSEDSYPINPSPPDGDGEIDYMATQHQVLAESGVAAPVKLSPTLTLTVPKTITITGTASDQFDDLAAQDATAAFVGMKGASGITYKGTVTFDQAQSVKANAGAAINGVPNGSLDYGIELVKLALGASYSEAL